MSRYTILAVVLGLAVLAACDGEGDRMNERETMAMADRSLTDIDASTWEALAAKRIFFGHQSVGRNIMDGVRMLADEHPELGLRVVTTNDPSEVDGPAFVDAEIGENRHPETKDQAFASILENGFGNDPGAVAMYKYCYVDMQPETDPEALFERYVDQIEEVRARYPELTIVHFTVPLTEAEMGFIEQIKTRFGQPTETALNIKRNRYNELLRERYQGTDPIFDLALIESTRADGSRAYSTYRGERVYMLAPEWTYDGGHLTDEAKETVAEHLLVFLAGLVDDNAVAAEEVERTPAASQ